MGALQLKATMVAIAAALEEVGVVDKAWPYPFESASPGEAIVSYPDEIEFDRTFQRGSDSAVIPVWVVVGVAGEESTADSMDRLVGAGTGAIKDALESGDHGGLDQVISYLHVGKGSIEGVKLGGVIYAALRMDCEVRS